MGKRLLLLLAAAGLTMAAAKTYSFDLYEPVMLGNTQLKPGHYDLQLTDQDQKATIRSGKMHEESAVDMQTANKKYDRTSVVLAGAEGQRHLQEVHIGGTKLKVVFRE